VIVVDFTLETTKGPPKQHHLAPQQMIDELTQAGFKASIIDIGLPDHYAVTAETR
jgi:hypothetical protein